jgi:hypothetical protein
MGNNFVTDEILNKIRSKRKELFPYERINRFGVILQDDRAKKRLIYGCSQILKELYSEMDGRWGEDPSPSTNRKGVGVLEIHEKTGVPYWSHLNFLNTNWSMLDRTLMYFEYVQGHKIVWESDPYKYVNDFLKLLYKFKEEVLLDSSELKWGDLKKIHSKTWASGEKHNNFVVENYQTLFPNSVDVVNGSSEKGLVDDFKGIDCTIIGTDGDKYYVQVKGCNSVYLDEGVYTVHVSMNLNSYKNIHYFVFCPSDETKVYVFKNDPESICNCDSEIEPCVKIPENLVLTISNRSY